MQKNLDIILSALICFIISGCILGIVGFLEIKKSKSEIEQKFFSVDQSMIEDFLQKIELAPDIVFKSAKDQAQCKRVAKILNNNRNYQLICKNNFDRVKERSNIIGSISNENRGYYIVIEIYKGELLSNINELYKGIELGTIELSYKGKDFILQNKGENTIEKEIYFSKNNSLKFGYSSEFISKLKNKIIKKYSIILLLIEISFMVIYLLFRRIFRNFILRHINEEKKVLLKQIKQQNIKIKNQRSLIEGLQLEQEYFTNSASFQVMWASSLIKSLKEALIKVAIKEKNNIEINDFLINMLKEGDMVKIEPKEIKDSILKIGSYITHTTEIKIVFTIKQLKMVELYINENLFLNVIYSLAYNVFRQSLSKTVINIAIDSNKKRFRISFAGLIMPMKNETHPLFESFSRVEAMIGLLGGELTIKDLKKGRNITLDFPIGDNEENPKIIKLEDWRERNVEK